MTEDRMDPKEAWTLLMGYAARWIRDEPYYPDASFWDFLERVWEPMGWGPERTLAAIGEADRTLGSLAPDDERAILGRCFEAIGLGALLRDREGRS